MRDADEHRRQLSRQLHDGPAQLVAAAAMSLELLRRDEQALGAPSRSALAGARQMLQECTRELSRLSHEENPPFLGEGGLLTAAFALARRIGDRLQLVAETPRPLPPQGPTIEIGAYRLLERAAERSFSAAHPITAQLSLRAPARASAPGGLQLTIAGTPPRAGWTTELQVLQQRTRLAGARLTVHPRGRQVELEVRFPAAHPTPVPTSAAPRRGRRIQKGKSGGP